MIIIMLKKAERQLLKQFALMGRVRYVRIAKKLYCVIPALEMNHTHTVRIVSVMGWSHIR